MCVCVLEIPIWEGGDAWLSCQSEGAGLFNYMCVYDSRWDVEG